ncbi:ABC transporter [Microgenomates group bacterium RBG_16_45_19]|nr:MAG: ABC transporter [Microgenomates group bacterium RBG_16_45_19]
MPIINVDHLIKYYQVHEKEPGLKGSFQSLFHRQYKQVKAVDDISFIIDQGELVGFIGPNGAGKTTTLKCLSGLLYPTGGAVEVLGFNPWRRQPEFQKQFALVMGQKNQLWWDLPALETFNLNKEIYEIPDKQYRQTLNQLVELLDVKDILKIQVRKLSLGQRMKCELIAALLHNPKVLFLDEPTIGLDVIMQKVMRDFIKAYNREYKSTIILTSHYMDDVKELCQRIIIIDNGKVMFDGLLQEVINQYARNKILTVTFAKPVLKTDLKPIGVVKDWQYPQAKILVPRSEAKDRAIKLMQSFPIDDINIEEPPIEAIIREVFSKNE